MRRFLTFALSSLMVAAVFAAWPAAGPVAAQGDPVTITIRDFAFDPPTVTITAGTDVTWVNEDAANHTVTSEDGFFDSGPIAQGESVTFTFNEPGTYAYRCDIHPEMTGTIEVTDGDQPAPAETAAPDGQEATAPPEEDATAAPDAEEPEATAEPEATEEAAAPDPADATTIGVTGDGRTAYELVGKIEQRGLEFTYYGYVTHIEGIDDAALFTEDNPADRTAATARLTFFGNSQATSRAVVEESVFAVASEGTLTFYFNEGGGADFATPEGFLSGTAVAEASGRFHNAVSVYAPELGLANGVGDFVQESAEAFAVDGTTYVLGASGALHRLSFTGIGALTDPDAPEATILVSGHGVTSAGATDAGTDTGDASGDTGEDAGSSEDVVVIELRELEGSGFSGAAGLAPNGEQTDVLIELEGDTGGNPVHIHQGTCDELDPNPLFPLPDVSDEGTSEDTVDVPLETLLAEPFAINVHLSATEIGVYVACGEIVAS